MAPNLPSGTVTFVFSDIEGSTKLWEQHPDAMKTALEKHDSLLRQAVESGSGHIIKSTGDGMHAVFEAATDAICAMIRAQQALQAEAWDEIKPHRVKVRMGVHSGEAQLRAGDYFGGALNRTARLMSVGHGGQVLLSNAAAELLLDRLPPDTTLRDLGEHHLKDLVRPEHVFQLVHPALDAEFPPLQTLDSFPNNLPVQLTSFVGRERELGEARQQLSSARLLSLIGPGGTGKTRLSLQLGAEMVGAYPDGVWFVELALLADAALIPQAIASVVGIREQMGMPLIDLLTDYLRAKRVLLILDNCEHLVQASAKLADQLLHACPDLKIIASSREALSIRGETIHRVPSLSLPEPDQVTAEALTHSEAVQLFFERAVAVSPKFVLTDKNARFVAQICRRLDGIPLALELAAARVTVLAPDQIASRLDDRFKLLTGGGRTDVPRQQTLRAMIDWSYEILSEPEQTLLRRLSVFSGTWTFEAAEAICLDLEVLDLLKIGRASCRERVSPSV
jgi:class 3 adenylate cyclase